MKCGADSKASRFSLILPAASRVFVRWTRQLSVPETFGRGSFWLGWQLQETNYSMDSFLQQSPGIANCQARQPVGKRHYVQRCNERSVQATVSGQHSGERPHARPQQAWTGNHTFPACLPRLQLWLYALEPTFQKQTPTDFHWKKN